MNSWGNKVALPLNNQPDSLKYLTLSYVLGVRVGGLVWSSHRVTLRGRGRKPSSSWIKYINPISGISISYVQQTIYITILPNDVSVAQDFPQGMDCVPIYCYCRDSDRVGKI